jgi:hypothetical protein
MFWKKSVQTQNREVFVVFISLNDSEGIAEHCESREEMMKKYFKYSEIIQKETFLNINDATIRANIIRYIRWIVQ